MNGTRSRFSLVGGVAIAFAIATYLLLVHPPSVHVGGISEDQTCAAPYTVGLGRTDSRPAGADPTYQRIETTCDAERQRLFRTGVLTGAVALGLGGLRLAAHYSKKQRA